MTDNDIIKALEEIAGYKSLNVGTKKVLHCAIDLTNRQKAEIERLKNSFDAQASLIEKKNLAYDRICVKHRNEIKNAKSEAIKEFAERLKEKASSSVTSCQGREIYETKQYQMSAVGLDNLVKEMVGDDNA